MTKEEIIEKVSEILNDTGAYKQIVELLNEKGVSGDEDLFIEWEEFLAERVIEEFPEDIEFKVTAEIEVTDEDGEIDNVVINSVNVFAKDEDEAMDKADDNLREQNPEWEDFCINILTVNEA